MNCNIHNAYLFIHYGTSRPHTWYPYARRKKRNVILHVGPTNSGKTHHALKQLQSSSSGKFLIPIIIRISSFLFSWPFVVKLIHIR